MRENVERAIRFKAFLIYIIFAFICGILIMFVYNMRVNVNEQKTQIEYYNNILSLTNELVFSVNEAQTEATLYISGKKYHNLKNFQKKIEGVELKLDSLSKISDESFNDSLLTQIGILLKEKGRIISQLNKQFVKQAPGDTLTRKLQTDPITIIDSVLISSTVKDTVINKANSRNFWGRLADVFSPRNTIDTVVTVSTYVSDTLKLNSKDKADIISGISGLAEQINTDYTNRLQAIEKQVTRLIRTDQEINIQLSLVLNSLSRSAMDATLNEILRSEQQIHNNYNFSIYGGILAIAFVLLLIFLIINDVNKGKTARNVLRQVMETRRQLLLSVSHDIKSPLNSILGSVEIWKKQGLIPGQQAKIMENSGQYIFALLNNLIEFSNIEQGELSVSENSFNLNTFSIEIVTMFDPLATRKNLNFDYRFDIDHGNNVCGDELKIKQIVVNILSNAVKYTKNGGIYFYVKYNEGKVRFKITDTGVGIPMDHIEDLFIPFKRIEKNNFMASGSGLGMYVVKGLIDLMDGEIFVNSKEGKGTEIEVILPLPSISTGKAIKSDFERILVIDDDDSILILLENMISGIGFNVNTCNKPEEFGNKINPLDYDLIITDMEMGAVSGKNILKISNEVSKDIPVVIMTGRGDYNKNVAEKDGFDFYLPKPVNQSMINRLLGVSDIAENNSQTFLELFADDKETLVEVLDIFIANTEENCKLLKQSLNSGNFNQAQSVCHKMLPMFLQFEDTGCIEILKWMDKLRGQEEKDHPAWHSKILLLITLSGEMLDQIKKNISDLKS